MMTLQMMIKHLVGVNNGMTLAAGSVAAFGVAALEEIESVGLW